MSLRRAVPLICICTLLLAAVPGPASAETLGFWNKIEKVADNANELSAIAASPTGELWLLERTTGAVKVTFNGVLKANLTVPVTSTNRAGLLGVAFAPDYGISGVAFVYYVDNTVKARVDKLRLSGRTLVNEGRILDLGTVSDTTKPGGGLAVGKDGKLYIGVGDLGAPSSAQDDNVNVGKVLRANLDGSVPADNPLPGLLCYAKGFRDTRALAVNVSSAYPEGTFYTPDGGAASPAAADEVNAVRRGGNYAWNSCSGASCSGFDAPLVTYASTGLVTPTSIAVNPYDAFGAASVNSVFFAAADDGDASKKGRIRELTLSGPNVDLLGTDTVLYDPRGDVDGTIESICPTEITALAVAGDGALYAGNGGAAAANTGLWRLYHDGPGPREVSAPGSVFPLTVERSAGNLKLTWENLGALDAAKAKRTSATARNEVYRIWEGDLGALRGSGAYALTPLLSTNGTADGVGKLTATVTGGSGAKYYLVQAQNDNYEGPLGAGSTGAAIPYPAGVTTDYCAEIGYDRVIGKCIRDFPFALKDYNRRSPTYGQRHFLRDFRGKVYKLALAAKNCGWCELEVEQEDVVDKRWRDQDFTFLSVFTKDYGVWHVFTEAECQAEIDTWVTNNNNPSTPIFCDEDFNGDTIGDYSDLMDQCNCAPQNFYVDPGGYIYNYVQGAQFSQDVSNNVKNEVHAEGCD